MRYVKIVPELPRLSRVALGTDYYGKTIPEDLAYRFLDIYTEAGGNIIDTAHVYSDYLPGEKHMSEKVIGRWLRKSGCSENCAAPFIATKGGFPEIGNMHASRISRQHIEEDLLESLECLGVKQVAIYWLHRDDPEIPAGEIVSWMEEFRARGLFKCWGVSNWRTGRIQEALDWSRKSGVRGPECSQIKWSLAAQTPGSDGDDTLVVMDRGEYSWYRENSFPVFAYSSQAKGFFSKLRRSENGEGEEGFIRPAGKAGIRYFNSENLAKYGELERLAGQTGLTVAQTAAAWMTQPRSVKVIPVIGASSEAQLKESLAGAGTLIEANIRKKYSIFGEYC